MIWNWKWTQPNTFLRRNSYIYLTSGRNQQHRDVNQTDLKLEYSNQNLEMYHLKRRQVQPTISFHCPILCRGANYQRHQSARLQVDIATYINELKQPTLECTSIFFRKGNHIEVERPRIFLDHALNDFSCIYPAMQQHLQSGFMVPRVILC